MTAIRDRRSDPDTADDATTVPWNERSAVGARRGVPWWGAVLISLVLAAAGAFTEQLLTGGLGVPFYVCFAVGSLVAVLAARRRAVFGPMVQPPLVMAVVVPTSVLTASGLPEGSDMLSKALAVGTPLINSFPVMAGVTVVTVALGTWRMVRERDPETRDRAEADAPAAPDRPRGDSAHDDGRPPRGDAAGSPATPRRERAASPPPAEREKPPRERSNPAPRRAPDRAPENEGGPRPEAGRPAPPQRGPRGNASRAARRDEPGRGGRGRPRRPDQGPGEGPRGRGRPPHAR